jgi:hypothetical protein
VAYPLAAAKGNVIEGSFGINPSDVQELALRSWYLNLHSAANPSGEVRGQVVRPGEGVFVASLSGAEEVPAVPGGSKGNAMVVFGSGGAKFLYVVKTDAPATLAHFHRAPGGSNGPVELPIEPVGAVMSGVLDLGDARRADIERGLWYVNVHSAANPKGEIRGQLLRPGETLLTAALAGSNEVPATTSTATGNLAVILNAARTELRYDGAAAGMMATAAHLHDAPAGMNGPVALPLTLAGATLTGTAAVTPEQVTKLLGGGFYVNLHSAQNPGGEIRGQLTTPSAAPAPVAPMGMTAPPAAQDSHGHAH